MNTDNNSLLTNLKNKVAYKIHSAVYDQKANEFAEKKIQNNAIETKQETTTENSKYSDNPDKFSTARLLKKTSSQIWNILSYIFIPFLSLMLAMIVANDMIVYSVPIRIIFFIFTFVVCYFTKFYTVILGIFYTLKGGYSYYYNNMTGKPPKDIMPTIFALLPITTYSPASSFAKFILYPFTYPKTPNTNEKIPIIMNNYYTTLIDSFKDFNNIKNLPNFIKGIKDIQTEFLQLHKINLPISDKLNN